MKNALWLILVLVLVGCKGENEYTPLHFPTLPPELSDCKFYYVSNENWHRLSIVRCPNSTTSTTYRDNKSQKTVIVIDGVEYEAVKKTPEKEK